MLEMICFCNPQALNRQNPSRCRKAVLFVRNAHHGRPPAEPTGLSLLARSVYHHYMYRIMYLSVAVLHACLAFVEPPGPRRDLLPRWLLLMLELFALSVYSFDLVVQRLYLGYDLMMEKRWAVAKMALIPLLAVNAIIVVMSPVGAFPNVLRAFRPVMLIERMRNVRRICGNIINMIPRVINVGILLAMQNIFFGIMAYVLFAGIDGENCEAFPKVAPAAERGAFGRAGPPCSTFLPDSCSNYFSSLSESMWQLFILTTTANFPDVMLPVYSCNSLSGWFFVLYFLIGASFLLNLTLAVALDEFKALTKRKVLERYDSMFLGFDMGYRQLLLDAGSIGGPAQRPRSVGRASATSASSAPRTGRQTKIVSTEVLDQLERKVDGEIEMEGRRNAQAVTAGAAVHSRGPPGIVGDGGDSGSGWPVGVARGQAVSNPVAGMVNASSVPSTRAIPVQPLSISMSQEAQSESGDAQAATESDSDVRRHAGASGGEHAGSRGSAVAQFLPRQQVDPGLSRAGWIKFFTELRAEATEELAGLFFDAVDREGRGRVYVHQFRRMMLWFACLSFKSAPKPSSKEQHRPGESRYAVPGIIGDSLPSSPSATAAAAANQLGPIDENEGLSQGGSSGKTRPNGGPLAPVEEWRPSTPSKRSSVSGFDPQSGGEAASTRNPQQIGNQPKMESKPSMRSQRALMASASGSQQDQPGPVAATAKTSSSCIEAVFDRLWRAAVAPQHSDTGIGEDAAFGGPLVGYESAVAAVYGTCSLPWLRAILSQRWTMWFFDFFVLVNGVAVMVELGSERDVDPEDGSEESIVRGLQVLQYVTLAVFLFEVLLGMVVWSPARYWKLSNFNKLDTVIAMGSIIVMVTELARGDAGQASQVSSGLTFFRMLRLLRALRVLPGFMLMVESLWDITTVIFQYVLVIVAVYYVFAVIGMEVFAGRLTNKNPDVAASAYGQDGFETLTFDSVPEAFVVLFYQMVVNNWVIICDGLCAAFQSRWPRLYFAIFYVVTVVIVLNMLLAFIIESFSVQKARREGARQYFGRKALLRLDRLQRLLLKLRRAQAVRTLGNGVQGLSPEKAGLLAERIADAATQLYGVSEMQPTTVQSTETFPDPESEAWPMIRREMSQQTSSGFDLRLDEDRDDDEFEGGDQDDGGEGLRHRERGSIQSAPVASLGAARSSSQLQPSHESRQTLQNMLRRPSVQPSKADSSGFCAPGGNGNVPASVEAQELSAAVISAQEERTGEEWRGVLQKSGLDFTSWRIWREPRPFDLYDSLFRDTIRSKYPQTFGTTT